MNITKKILSGILSMSMLLQSVGLASLIAFVDIASATAASTSGSTDLSIGTDSQVDYANNENIRIPFYAVNNGLKDAHGANVKITLPAGQRDIELSCENALLGAVCPATETFADGITEINTILETFPNKGSVDLILSLKLPLVPPTSAKYEAEISVPVGMTERIPKSNTANKNANIITGSADTTVSQVSQTKAGGIATTSTLSANGFYNIITIDDPKPISFTTRYENKGPGYADGANIYFNLEIGKYVYMEYSNFSLQCTAHGNAVCPTYFSGKPAENGSGNANS